MPSVDAEIFIEGVTFHQAVFRSMGYLEQEGEEFIYLFPFSMNRVQIFRKVDAKYVWERDLDFHLTNEDGHEDYAMGASITSQDSVYLFTLTSKVVLFDWEGNKIEEFRYDGTNDGKSSNGKPHILQSSYVYRHGDFILGSTLGNPELPDDEVGFYFSVNDPEFKWIVKRSDIEDGYHGRFNNHAYTNVSASLEEDEAIVSIASSHEVFKISLLNGEIVPQPMASPLIGDISPLDKKPEYLYTKKEVAHQGSQGWYSEVISNPYTDQYYRIAFAPVPFSKTKEDALRSPHIIVSDNDFEVTGVYSLPDDYPEFGYIITQDGLCLMNELKSDPAADILMFDCFSFEHQ